MYKKVKKYVKSIGFTVEEKAGLAYGQLNGVFVAIRQHPTISACHTIQIAVKQGSEEPIPSIADFINQCKSKFKYLSTATYNENQITVDFHGVGFKWMSEYTPTLGDFLQEITLYCRNNALVQCCESCKTEFDLSLYQLEDSNPVLCSACYSDLMQNIEYDKAQKRKEGNGNIVGGIVGGLLGGLIGVAVWVLIYQLGYISSIAGLVMVVCTFKGYEIMGGRLNKLGITLCIAISLLLILLSEQLSVAIEIYNTFNQMFDITFFDAFRSVPEFLAEPEIKEAVIFELVMGYALLAVGAWQTVRHSYKNNSSVKIRKVTSVTGSATGIETDRQ